MYIIKKLIKNFIHYLTPSKPDKNKNILLKIAEKKILYKNKTSW